LLNGKEKMVVHTYIGPKGKTI